MSDLLAQYVSQAECYNDASPESEATTSAAAAITRCGSRKWKRGKRNSHMKHLGLFVSFLAIQSLALSGCGGGTSSVGQTAQFITFNNPGTQTVGVPLTLSATANSGVAVSFASTTPSVCTVSGTTATFSAAGTCTINASLAGNGTYTAAAQVTQSFTVNPAIGPTTTVYIVGEEITSSPGAPDETSAAEEWRLKSGSPTATATTLSLPSGMTSSVASAIVVYGGDVYVAGTALNNTSESAVLWVNGTATTLSPPSGMVNPVASAIAVSGGNVYVAGSASTSAGISAAILWVNGAATTLSPPSGMVNCYAATIAVSGGDVYVAGAAWNSNLDRWATYWVNGAASLLPMPDSLTVNYYANGIAVSGGDVYVSGYTDSGMGNLTAVSWANSGWATTLPLPGGWMLEDYTANGITVSGSDVYVVGGGVNNVGTSTAAYWRNSTPTTLPLPGTMPNSSAASYANGIAISSSDVYAVGYVEDSIIGVDKTAAYWVNGGEGTLLPMPTGAHKSWANAITVSTQ